MNKEPSESWWTPQQLQLVMDRSRRWVKRDFLPSDAIMIEVNGTKLTRKSIPEESGSGVLIKDGWDHEHCSLCWKKISLSIADEKAGFVDGRDWLCEECFNAFIVPRLRSGTSALD